MSIWSCACSSTFMRDIIHRACLWMCVYCRIIFARRVYSKHMLCCLCSHRNMPHMYTSGAVCARTAFGLGHGVLSKCARAGTLRLCQTAMRCAKLRTEYIGVYMCMYVRVSTHKTLTQNTRPNANRSGCCCCSRNVWSATLLYQIYYKLPDKYTIQHIQ